MAAKKKVTRTHLRRLSRQTRAELKKLAGRQKAGTITGNELQTGLKEVNRSMKKLSIWIHIICN
jgi:hypothetical protein